MADLTLAERERLIKLNEELSESIERMGLLIQAMGKANQAVCKTLLHGYTTTFEGVDYDNRDDIMREIGDVEAILELMIKRGDLNRETIANYRDIKSGKLSRYLKHQDIVAEVPPPHFANGQWNGVPIDNFPSLKEEIRKGLENGTLQIQGSIGAAT